MKTIILRGSVIISIGIGLFFLVDAWGPGRGKEVIEPQASTQSIQAQPIESSIIYCPLAKDIRSGNTPTFSYWDQNTGHPLQDNLYIRNVIAGINNEKAICKYTSTSPDKIFTIILPGTYSTCSTENDEYVGFICP